MLCGSVHLSYGQKSQTNGSFRWSNISPRVIQLGPTDPDDGIGGLIVADVDDDGRKDFIVTKPNHVGAYSHFGHKLWIKEVDLQVTLRSELYGLPGWHAPGVQAADIDGDGNTEVLYLTQDGALHVVHGSTGGEKWRLNLPGPEGAERWEHVVVANFRGKGDRDLLLQTTNAANYRIGRYIAAYAFSQPENNTLKQLWARDDFLPAAHSGARVADLDGDGRDEVLGGTIVAHNGEILFRIPVKGHIDSILVADVRADIPGLEVVALEEGGRVHPFAGRNILTRMVNRLYARVFPTGNRVFLYNSERLIWESHFKSREAQTAAVGDFDPSSPGLEIWCRSRYNRSQKPFVFDSRGETLSHYRMDDVAPEDWTESGVEVIWSIDWTGEAKQLAAAKERQKAGDVAIFDPVTGRFLHRFKERADRVYVADVLGDWREELIVLNGNKLNIYENKQRNPNPQRPGLWNQNQYRRRKMTWNYFTT
jgi:hypothetical protein